MSTSPGSDIPPYRLAASSNCNPATISQTEGKASMNPIRDLLEGVVAEHVISFEGTSQYTQGGTSACGLAALNAVRIILGRESSGVSGVELLEQIAGKEMIEEVIAICATWSSQLHLEVDEIATLPLFKNTLVLSFSEYNQAVTTKFTNLLRRLEEASQASHSSLRESVSAAAVITRPPEILTAFCIPTHSHERPSVFVVFDSHPRPAKGAKGASFILFATVEATSQYISGLLQIDSTLRSALPGMQWQAQLLGHYSGHVYLAHNNYNFDVNPMQPIYDANMAVLELKSRLAEVEEKFRTLTLDNTRLRECLTHTDSKGKSSRTLSPSSVRSERKAPNSSTLKGRKAPRHNSPHPVTSPIDSDTTRNFQNVSGDSYKPSTSNRESERVDAALAARLYREQDQELASFELAQGIQEELDREDEELQYQLQQLQQTAQVLFKCGICLDEHSMDYVAPIDACQHHLCRSGMKDFVTSKLEEHRYPIVCPICQLDSNVKNPGAIDGHLIEQLGLTQAQHAVWIELELSEFSIVLDCPGCRRSTFVDLADHTDMELLRCPLPDCSHAWCKQCTRQVETGTRHSCDGTSELNDLMTSRGWRHCPGCQTPTEKRGGCNHMTCIAPGCNTHFCYVCGESIVRSARRTDIQAALNTHYNRCHLFENVPDPNEA